MINESILGAALIRLLNSQQYEYDKFLAANTQARDISLSILRLFASLIPVIMFATNLATLMILALGGRFVIQGSMSSAISPPSTATWRSWSSRSS